jgi:hypothetical protein
MKSKLLFPFLLLFFFSSGLITPVEGGVVSDSVKWNLHLGLSGGIHRLQDEGMSLNRYSGFLPGVTAFLQKEKNNRVSTASWLAQKAELTPVGREGRRANRTAQDSFQFDYSLMFFLKQKHSEKNKMAIGFHAGAFIRSRYSPKLGNSARTYDGFVHLGPSFMLQKELHWTKKRVVWRSYSSIPLVAGVVRPSLTNLRNFFDPTIPDFQSRWEQHGWVMLGREFTIIRMGTGLHYFFPSQHQLRIQYDWEYLQYHKVNAIQSALHRVTLGYVFSLNQ